MWQSCVEKRRKHQIKNSFMTCGCSGVPCVDIAFPFVLGRTVLKALQWFQMFFASAHCFLCLPRLAVGPAIVLGQTWADLWLVKDPEQLLEPSCVLEQVLPSEDGKLPNCCLQRMGNSPTAALPPKQHCHLPSREEECMKCSCAQQGYKLSTYLFNWHSWRCLSVRMPTLVGHASGSSATHVAATGDCRGLLDALCQYAIWLLPHMWTTSLLSLKLLRFGVYISFWKATAELS